MAISDDFGDCVELIDWEEYADFAVALQMHAYTGE